MRLQEDVYDRGMTRLGWMVLLLTAVLLCALYWRSRRTKLPRFKSEARTRSGRPGLIRPGLLELQHLIEPEKKVEILLHEEDAEEEEHSGAPPEPPSR